MTIEDFLEILQDRDLVPEAIVTQVRAKVAKGDRRITPKSLLKYLVKKEFVTKRQAKQLLETTLTVTPNAESSILGMVPMPKVPPSDHPQKKSAPVSVGSDEDIPTIAPVEEDSSGLVTDDGPTIGSGVDLFGEKPASLVSESISKIGMGADPTLTEAITEGNLDSSEPTTKREKKKKRVKKNEWDSNLILLGGGGLILLVIVGVIIFYLLTRENADAILAEASEYFDGGSYTQAIKQYDRFIENHQKHPEFSAAKVKLGLAKLWKASSGTSNFEPALVVAKEVLADIEDEEEFNSAQRDLASLLPDIAEGLASQAETASEPERIADLVQQTNEALSFCANTKYIPKSFRDEIKISEINQTLERVERSRSELAALTKGLADIQGAIEARDTARAYQVHEQLIDEHPGLINNEQLSEKILEISQAESAVVEYVEESENAATQPRPSEVVAELALANRTGPSGLVAGRVAVRVSGAVYGFDTSDGSLIWRRFVGMAPGQYPVRIDGDALLVVDPRYNELLKLSAANGELVWRHQFESEIATPTVLRDQVLVAATGGRLHVLDQASGERKGYVKFAQRLSAPPAIGSQGKRIYITGEHSSLYTLSSTDFSCLGVFFLGHSKGSARVPPINVLNKVIVPVSTGLSTSQLEVIDLNADGIPQQRASRLRLSGLVNTSLLSQGRRLVVMTSKGEVVVYDVGAGSGEKALTQIAQREPGRGDMIARHGMLKDGHVWVAGPELSKLAILPTSDRLSVSNIDNDYAGDVFDHRLEAVEDLLIHVRHPQGEAGAVVAAMNLETGRSQWQSEIAASPAGPPAADPSGMQLGVVNSTGASYLVDRNAMRNRVANQADKASALRIQPLEYGLDLGNGRIVAAAIGSERLLHFRPGLPRGAAQTIKLKAPISCPPVAWQDGFVVPTTVGQVFLYTSEDGQQWGSPFQPPLKPGVTYSWNAPAVYGSGEDSKLILTDGSERIYVLSREPTPQPHLSAIQSADVTTAALNTRLAVLGNLAFAGAQDGSLSTFQLPSLEPGDSVKLGSQVTWGPFAVGDALLLATAAEELVSIGTDAQILWKSSFTHGPPAGRPIAHQNGIEVLWQQGGISRLSADSGDESSFVALPQPVVAGPVKFGKRLVVSAYDGTLLIVNHPE